MQLAIDPIPVLNDPLGAVQTRIHLTNDTVEPMALHQIRPHIWVGRTRNISGNAFYILPEPDMPDTLHLGPDETVSLPLNVQVTLAPFIGLNGLHKTTVRISLDIYAPIPDPLDGEKIDFDSYLTVVEIQTPLTVDLDGIEWLRRPDGGDSAFFRLDGQVFHQDSSSNPVLMKLKDPSTATALTAKLLQDGPSFHFGSYTKRKASKGALRGLNAVFYRAGDLIFTEYGGAKIDDPATFEVVDDGVPSLFGTNAQGYLCSYARDAFGAYFFCGSTSTPKAIKVRACKSPETLVSLGQSFAKDAKNVYLEGRTIKGADPASFKMLSAYYWRDKKGIGFMERRVPDADPDTFEPVDEFYKGNISKVARFSSWGRDKFGQITNSVRKDHPHEKD